MRFAFDTENGLVIVFAELFGPSASAVLRLAVDTGATSTLLNAVHLVAVGYDPALVPVRVQVTTGSGMEYVPRVQIVRIKALGQERVHFPVLSHTLPPTAPVDGLLGLDFLRGQRLVVDFRTATVSLS